MIIRNNPSIGMNQNPSFKKSIVITNGAKTFLYDTKEVFCILEGGKLKVYPMMKSKTKAFSNHPARGGSKTGKDTVTIEPLAELESKIGASEFADRLVEALKKGADKLISLGS